MAMKVLRILTLVFCVCMITKGEKVQAYEKPVEHFGKKFFDAPNCQAYCVSNYGDNPTGLCQWNCDFPCNSIADKNKCDLNICKTRCDYTFQVCETCENETKKSNKKDSLTQCPTYQQCVDNQTACYTTCTSNIGQK